MKMKAQKKRTDPTTEKFSIKNIKYKNLITILYHMFVVMSILNHNITNLSSLISELIIYTVLGIMVYVVVKNTSLKGFAKFWNELD